VSLTLTNRGRLVRSDLTLSLLLSACLARPACCATLLHTTLGPTRATATTKAAPTPAGAPTPAPTPAPAPAPAAASAATPAPVTRPARFVSRHVSSTEGVILLLKALLPTKTKLGVFELPLLAWCSVGGVEPLTGLAAPAATLLLLAAPWPLVHLSIKIELTSKTLRRTKTLAAAASATSKRHK
jgi:hypothetical protein